MSEIDRERARQGCALAAPATKDGRLSGLAAAGQRCVVGVVCVCVGSEVWASPSVRGLRHASMGEVEGRTVGRPKGEPPKLAWSRCKAKSLPRGWLGRKRSGGYILLHARHPMDLTPWCSWLSRQPNMLKVSGSNPDGNRVLTFCRCRRRRAHHPSGATTSATVAAEALRRDSSQESSRGASLL